MESSLLSLVMMRLLNAVDVLYVGCVLVGEMRAALMLPCALCRRVGSLWAQQRAVPGLPKGGSDSKPEMLP